MPGSWPLPSEIQYVTNEKESQSMRSSRSRYSTRKRGNALTRPAVGFKNTFSLLETPQPITRVYRQFPVSTRDSLQASSIPDEVPRRLPSPILTADSKSCSDGLSVSSLQHDERGSSPHGLLVPDVRVTPEIRMVSSGCHSLWVAVELTARWNTRDQNDLDIFESCESHPFRSPHSVDLGELHKCSKTSHYAPDTRRNRSYVAL